MIAILLNYFLLRHVNRSNFLGPHKKEVLSNTIALFTRNVNKRNKGIIFGCKSGYKKVGKISNLPISPLGFLFDDVTNTYLYP